jgi:hypothetical protein
VCSLREAVIAANADAASGARAGECPAGSGADTIVVPAGAYALVIPPPFEDEDAATNGDLDLLGAVTIAGAGAATTVVDGSRLDRVFDVLAGATVAISGLTITGGLRVAGADPDVGGGIRNRGALTLTASAVRGNVAGEGGGIANEPSGRLTLVGSAVIGNRALTGGGIRNEGTLTATESRFSANGAVIGGGIANRGVLALAGGAIGGNEAVADELIGGGDGGGLQNAAGATATLDGVTVADNLARGVRTTPASGGGIDNGGRLTLRGSTVSANLARNGDGGGIWNRGTLTLANSTLSGNRVTGFLFDVPGGGTITIGGSGSAIFDFADPADVASPGTIDANNVTVADNASDRGGAGVVVSRDAVLRLRNSILAGSAAAAGPAPDCAGTLTSGGHNLIETPGPSCTIEGDPTGNLIGVDPRLGPLAANGGPTFTRPPLPGSPAIDAGNPAAPGSGGAACEPVDQRGVARPQDGDGDGAARCDIGAVELARSPVVTVTLTLPTARPVVQTVAGLTPEQHVVRVQNGTPGLRSVRLTVNGRVLPILILRDGEVRTLDIARFLRPGATNVVRLETPWGTPGTIGGGAVITIGP